MAPSALALSSLIAGSSSAVALTVLNFSASSTGGVAGFSGLAGAGFFPPFAAVAASLVSAAGLGSSAGSADVAASVAAVSSFFAAAVFSPRVGFLSLLAVFLVLDGLLPACDFARVFAFGFDSVSATGFGAGCSAAATAGAGAGAGAGLSLPPKIRFKMGFLGGASETTLGFGGGMVLTSCADRSAEKGSVVRETTTSSFRIGSVGKSGAFVFQRTRLSSLSSNNESGATALRSWAEINLAALKHNLAALRTHVAKSSVMAVVKADAYGHGISHVVQALAAKVEMFGVANLTEARSIRQILEESAEPPADIPVFILSPALPAEREAVVGEGFVAAVSSVEEAAAYAVHGSVRLHLALDTGMGRMGVWQEDAVDVARAIRQLPGVELAGICSHLPVADEDDAYTQNQLDRFHSLAHVIASECSPAPLIHVENSAGAIAFPAHARGLIRAGLALYGVSPRPEFQSHLQSVMTWKTRVTLVRELGSGRSISYGRTFITDAPTRVATLAVGYADGYPRQVSGRGAHVLIRGQRCPVLGRVTMDQIMVDVSVVEGVAPGEEVTLLGYDGAEEISAVTLANWADTIAWDIFTGIGLRVVRVPIDKSPPFQTENPK
jgi:alanine racemase